MSTSADSPPALPWGLIRFAYHAGPTMSITTLRKYVLSFACTATLSSTSEAALTISATRVVHSSDKHSSSVVVANPSRATYAVQAW